MKYYISISLVCLAAFFKAVADTLQHHYYTSVFKKLNPKWWDPAISWEYVDKIQFTGYRPDAWHLSNSLMIISFLLAIIFYKNKHPRWIEFIIGGIVFNLVFGLFYSIIF